MAKTHFTSLTGKSPIAYEGLEPMDIKKRRIKFELKLAGVTPYGMIKGNTRYLPKLLHDNEHIMAIIYGRYGEASGLLNYVDRMIVATDKRLLSLNHKPGYTDTDEFTYDIIDGIEMTQAGPFVGVRLNTKVDHFTLKFVNAGCAKLFVNYVEQRRLQYT